MTSTCFTFYVQVYFYPASVIILYVSPNILIATKAHSELVMHNWVLVRYVLPPHGLKVFISSRVSVMSEGGLHVGSTDCRFESVKPFTCKQVTERILAEERSKEMGFNTLK